MRNSRGSALLIVLIIVASAIATTLAILQGATSASQIYSRKAGSQTADNLTQLIGATLSDPSVCLGGFDGTGTAESGLQFTGGFNAATAANGQDISLPSNFPNGSARLRLQNGVDIPNSSLRIQRLFAKAQAIPGTTDEYSIAVMSSFQLMQGTTLVAGLAPRKILDLNIKIAAGAASATTCALAPDVNSNQTLCEGMNCEYTVSSTGQGNCFCPIKEISCPNGRYIEAVGSNYTASCSSSTITKSCAGTPSNYLIGLDGSGNAVCAEALSCPAGTSAGGFGGGVTGTPECKCNVAGTVWNGVGCGSSSSVNGTCGTANGSARAVAPSTTAELCSAGTPSTVSGSGPWNWSCGGSGGGSIALCSASVGATAPPPPGSLCLNQTSMSCSGYGCASFSGCNPVPTTSGTTSCTTSGSTCVVSQRIWTCGGCAGTVCPTGSSISGLGGATSTPGCSCLYAGQTWNGTACTSPQPIAMCPDQVTQLLARWSSVSSCYNSSGVCRDETCTYTYLPGQSGSSAYSNCNPASASTCISQGLTWVCQSNCTGPASCAPGRVWNGSSCVAAPVVNGTCGAANGTVKTVRPTTSLCNTGTATTVAGTGPFTWTCTGANGGTSENCTTISAAPSTSLCFWRATYTVPMGLVNDEGSYYICPLAGSEVNPETGTNEGGIYCDSSKVGVTKNCGVDAGGTQGYKASATCMCNAPTCTGGASTTVTANAASPSGCYCPTGQTWNGSSCVVSGPICTGGATTIVTSNAASPSGCFCPTGKTWDGTNCVASTGLTCGDLPCTCPSPTAGPLFGAVACTPGYISGNQCIIDGSEKAPPNGWVCQSGNGWSCPLVLPTGCSSVSDPAPCPQGSSTSGTGNDTSIPGCKCDAATPRWRPLQNICVVGSSCPSGSSTTGIGTPTNVAGCFCNAMRPNWDGTACQPAGSSGTCYNCTETPMGTMICTLAVTCQ